MWVLINSVSDPPDDDDCGYDVGFYKPDGTWVMYDWWEEVKNAERQVHYLNGGNRTNSYHDD